MNIKDIEEYTPNSHGEHGVDAVLHGIAEASEDLHEVACEPPGGSWNQVDIIQPVSEVMYRWDNLPRNPSSTVKKPDEIIESFDGTELDILLIESKKSVGSLDPEIGSQMQDFFQGNEDFLGVRERPAWHKKLQQDEWSVLAADEPEEHRYWLKNHDDISVWTGFSYALDAPSEIPDSSDDYADLDSGGFSHIETELSEALSDSDIDVALTVTWGGEYEYPVLFVKSNEDFKTSLIWTALEDISRSHNLDIVLL